MSPPDPVPQPPDPGDAGNHSPPARPWPALPRLRRTDLLPSAADVTLVGVLSLLVALPAFDTDIWWHLVTGEWILGHGTVPTVDLFSFTAAGRPWVAHEWLSEVLLALWYRVAGLGGLAVFQSLAIVATLSFAYHGFTRRGAPAVLAAALVVPTLLLLLPAFHPRPYLFTLVFLAVLADRLPAEGPPPRGAWIGVPLLFALWANLHAGFVLGLALLALAALAEGWRLRRVPLEHGALLALAAIGACLNPRGPALLAYPLEYQAGSVHTRLISEWASPSFQDPFGWLLEIFLFAALAAAVTGRGAGWRRDVLVVLAFGHLALVSVRNIPPFAALAAPVIAGALAARLPAALRVAAEDPLVASAGRSSPAAGLAAKLRALAALDRRLQGRTWLGLAAIFAVLSAARGGPGEGPGSPRVAEMAGWGLPVGAVEHLRAHGSSGRLLNDYAWGGYLLWARPGVPVFVDGRADVYGEEIVTDYASMARLEPGWEALLAQYDVGSVLLPPGAPLVGALAHVEGWRTTYADAQSVLLERDGP